MPIYCAKLFEILKSESPDKLFMKKTKKELVRYLILLNSLSNKKTEGLETELVKQALNLHSQERVTEGEKRKRKEVLNILNKERGESQRFRGVIQVIAETCKGLVTLWPMNTESLPPGPKMAHHFLGIIKQVNKDFPDYHNLDQVFSDIDF